MPDFEYITHDFNSKLDNYQKAFGNKFLIAVSGGGDSLALAKLCFDYSKCNNDIIFEACIIDHGIADNSKDVAHLAKQRLDEIGVFSTILKPIEKITPPIQENARKARFDLLTQYAHDIDACGILLGHNYDDQIETVIFRMARNSNIYGIGGIDEIKLSKEFTQTSLFLRPLMHAKRHELRDFLKANNIEYFDDPANENQKYSRVFIRKFIANSKIDQNAILKIADHAKSIRANFDKIGFEFIKNNASPKNGDFVIDYERFYQLPFQIQVHILGRILEIMAHKNHPIEAKKIENLIINLKQDNYKPQTLANILIKKKKQNIILEIAKVRKHQKNIILKQDNQQLNTAFLVRFNQFGDNIA
ncbi:MAG: tRNA lysidine(34) synthetase TilS [Caulobacterales bacterium]|nr:tRNA lysidine(34) synthetase TilS [Caulobacterales bacterium]MCA0373760.1 tRNA lysidine(34) synthetase TilS [Pseudomonadota bacterium]